MSVSSKRGSGDIGAVRGSTRRILGTSGWSTGGNDVISTRRSCGKYPEDNIALWAELVKTPKTSEPTGWPFSMTSRTTAIPWAFTLWKNNRMFRSLVRNTQPPPLLMALGSSVGGVPRSRSISRTRLAYRRSCGEAPTDRSIATAQSAAIDRGVAGQEPPKQFGGVVARADHAAVFGLGHLEGGGESSPVQGIPDPNDGSGDEEGTVGGGGQGRAISTQKERKNKCASCPNLRPHQRIDIPLQPGPGQMYTRQTYDVRRHPLPCVSTSDSSKPKLGFAQ